jgi:hypothetical protein
MLWNGNPLKPGDRGHYMLYAIPLILLPGISHIPHINERLQVYYCCKEHCLCFSFLVNLLLWTFWLWLYCVTRYSSQFVSPHVSVWLAVLKLQSVMYTMWCKGSQNKGLWEWQWLTGLAHITSVHTHLAGLALWWGVVCPGTWQLIGYVQLCNRNATHMIVNKF